MASQYKKTIVLGLDYSEFSGGISECNRKMGLLDSSMKLASEQAKGFGDETDQLRIKQEGLTQKINLQKKIVEQQANAFNKATEQGGKNEKQLDSLNKAYIESQTKLKRLENELGDVTDEIKKMEKSNNELEESIENSGDKISSFGDVIRDVADYLDASGNPIVENFASKFDGLNSKVAYASLKVGTLVGSFAALTVSTSEHAREIEITSQKLGMTTDQYQVWDYVLKSVGSSAENASGDFASLAEKARDAANGGEENAKLFRELGISLKDNEGNLKTQGELFNEIVFSLMNMRDETNRNAIASDLLGQTGEDLVPILNKTGEEFKTLAQKAYESGNVIDEYTLEKFSSLNEDMQEFKKVIEGLGNKSAQVFLPILTALFEAISVIPVPVLQALTVFIGSLAIATMIARAIKDISGGMSAAKDMFSEFNPVALKTKAVVLGVAAAVLLLLAAVAALSDKGGDFRYAIREVGNTVSKIQVSTSQAAYNARGTEYFEGGRTWVGEEGAELIDLPPGTRIYNHRESRRIGQSGNTYFYVTIDAKNVKEFNDIVRIAENERRSFRIGRVRG